MTVLEYNQIDPCAMAYLQMEWLERRENWGYLQEEIDRMDAETYSEFLASNIEFDL